jgi:hypothetical protein
LSLLRLAMGVVWVLLSSLSSRVVSSRGNDDKSWNRRVVRWDSVGGGENVTVFLALLLLLLARLDRLDGIDDLGVAMGDIVVVVVVVVVDKEDKEEQVDEDITVVRLS